MKMKQKLIAGAIALSAMAGFAVPAAHAEVSAAVGAANMYYWRGLDLGNGDPQIWGDLKVSGSGFYGGVWAGSGDSVGGQEYDLYVGYGNSVGDFTFDLSVWSYSYPKPSEGGEPVSPGDLVEAVAMIGYGPIAFTYYENLEGADDYNYMTLAGTFGDFTIKYGVHEDDLAHVDLTYAYNDKLSFTVGKVVDDVDGSYNDEAKFVVGFALPIE
ncbi:TorF family putative porin [Cellvibrio sp. OA-2007]|uniref:TorF family putative porin n=1 Tax=Cellvibrio sp. OA-2007 TaxID=529823 RepID=UPI000783453D|nr:TorF family putative porin [Cellvibrio sp. OA-2007]